MTRLQQTLILLVLLFVALSGIGVHSGNAQDVEDLDFVFGTNHYDGILYSSAMVPPSVKQMFLIADHTNVVAARFTDIYYWPITNEYRADWDKANIIIDGQLEILQGGSLLQVITLTEYVIQYDANDQVNTIQFYFGQDALEARENFEELQRQYRQDLSDYHGTLNEYRIQFQKALSDLQAGLITEEELPVMPEPLADLSLFSTNILMGFPINLPVGLYQIQFRSADGALNPDSQKALQTFRSIRSGVGYKIIPEERWTAPEFSQDESEVIYSLRGKTFYIQPYDQELYNQLYYTRMNNPQDRLSRTDLTTWVAHQPIQNALLKIQKGSSVEEIELRDFFVQQFAGSRLGYEIVEFDPESMNSPSFSGFKVEIEHPFTNYTIELGEREGQVTIGSHRHIRVILVERQNLIYVVSGIPLLVGIGAIIIRKRTIRDEKVIEGG
jgi:hypothetical protein